MAFSVYGSRIRAKLRNLYQLAHGPDKVDKVELEKDIQFLRGLLVGDNGVVCRPLVPPVAPPAVIFTDAEGDGGCGAVLVVDSLREARSRFATVPECLVEGLKKRKTQIVAYELVVPGAAVMSWREAIAGRRVVFYIDNNSALAILQNGRSRRNDLNKIAFQIHDLCHRYHVVPYFLRVDSASNPSDPVSRRGRAPFGFFEGSLEWFSFFSGM